MWMLNDDGEFVECNNNRVIIPQCYIRKSNLLFIEDSSNRHGISRSKSIERIISYMLSNQRNRITITEYTKNGKRRISANGKHGNQEYIRIPKFYLLPYLISGFKKESKKRGISYTILLDEMILSYIKKFSFFDYPFPKAYDITTTDKNEEFFNFMTNVGGMRDRAIEKIQETIKRINTCNKTDPISNKK